MNEIVTIIGSSYFEPISLLLERLRDSYENNNSVGVKQNGYAASACLLSVVCLESYVMRCRYINSASGDDLKSTPVNKYIKKLYCDFPHFDKTTELFVIRDVLAHNHLLNLPISRNNEGEFKIEETVRISTGDKKFSDSVHLEKEQTKILGINTNPINIGYKDASIVLKAVWEILLFLENKDKNQCYVSHLWVKHKGTQILFGKLIESL